jgi:hypothetical protein
LKIDSALFNIASTLDYMYVERLKVRLTGLKDNSALEWVERLIVRCAWLG